MLRKSGNWYTNMQTHTHPFCMIFDTYELSYVSIFHSNAHSYCISLPSSHRICHYSLVCMMHSLASISSRVVFVALIVCYSSFLSGDRTRGCHVEVEADRRQRDSLRHRCRRIAVADSRTHPLAISNRRTDGRRLALSSYHFTLHFVNISFHVSFKPENNQCLVLYRKSLLHKK